MLAPDDCLFDPDALGEIRKVVAQYSPDAVYGDLIVAGRRVARPAWSPTRAQSCPSSFLPLIVRSAILSNDLAEFSNSANVTELFVAALWELVTGRRQVLHMPMILSRHQSVPAVDVTPVELAEGVRYGTFRRKPDYSKQTDVSVVIPTAGAESGRLINTCLAMLEALTPAVREIVVVVGDEYRSNAEDLELPSNARVLYRGGGEFNYSTAINAGAAVCEGAYLLLLNDDVSADNTDWLGRMLAHFEDEDLGIVGAQLLYPSGEIQPNKNQPKRIQPKKSQPQRIQHCGMVMDQGKPLHPFVGWDVEDLARYDADLARDVISVTGACLLTRRDLFQELRGLSTDMPLSYNDVDYCLRVRQAGHRVVMEPNAVLTHHESASRAAMIERWEWKTFVKRWSEVEDPWYHPAYFRPDNPHDLRKNADHLDPIDLAGRWPVRGTEIVSRRYRRKYFRAVKQRLLR